MIRQEEETKGIHIGKMEVKLSLFADGMIVFTENPKGSAKKLLNLISEFSKVGGIQNQYSEINDILYTNNELSEREAKKKIPFTIETKKL